MQTVIGVFDTVEEAQDAQKSLLSAGFDRSEVRIQSQSTLKSFDSESSTTTSSRSGDSSSGSGEGFMASIGNFFSNLFGSDNEHAEHAGHYSEAVRRGGSVLVVTAQDESQVQAARTALSAAGAVDIDKRAAGWRQDGYSGFDPAAQPFGAKEVQADRSKMQAQTQAQTQPLTANAKVQAKNNAVLPIVKEEIEIGKREVDLGAVRVFSRTEMRPVSEQVQLREQHADIQRRPVDRPAAEADLKAFEGGSIEVKEMAERAVVSKTARVVEEVVVGTQASTRTETISDQVRNTVVDVEKTGEDNSLNQGNQGNQGTPDYRNHYQANLANTGVSYEDYEPAYRYGYGMRTDSRYANRAWNDVEGEAQRDWSSHNPNGNWEKFKQAVKHGWDSMTGSNTSSAASQRKVNTST